MPYFSPLKQVLQEFFDLSFLKIGSPRKPYPMKSQHKSEQTGVAKSYPFPYCHESRLLPSIILNTTAPQPLPPKTPKSGYTALTSKSIKVVYSGAKYK